MNTKLTLTIEQKIIQKAKEYAKKQNRSLSDIIENYLKTLTKEAKHVDSKEGTIVKSLKGAFKISEDVDYRTEIENELTKKHLDG